MAGEPTTREAKLIQYLNEAYGKEKELETALKAHISMTTRDAYKKRLREHLKETSAQAKGLERRIKALGGKAEAVSVPGPDVASEAAAKVTSAAKKGVSLAKGPLHMIRGTGEAEKLLKNAKTELWNEMEEIANYLAIEELANALYDQDTAKLAREFRRQEERMAAFLQKLIPQLAKQVVREDVPAKERKPATAPTSSSNGASRSSARSSSSSRSSTRSSSSGTSSRSGARKTAASSSGTSSRSGARKTAASSSGSSSRSGSRSSSSGSRASSSGTRKASASSSGTRKSTSSRAKKS
jgi:ferritin-like metal-binding protein YciE